MDDATITVRQVLQLVLEAVSYPCIGNTDWADAAELEAQALAMVPHAIASPDDPPEFRQWLDTLSKPNRRGDERDTVLDAMADYLEAAKRKTFV